LAKRAVLDHPKFARLKVRLRLNKSCTLGYLECLWQMTGRFTPQGNIGQYSDEDIEAWMEWEGDPGALIVALVDSGWIDRDDDHRLIVHDWNDHVDHTTKTALNRAGLAPICSNNSGSNAENVRTVREQCANGVRTECAPPEPEPVNKPEESPPSPHSKYPDRFDEFWDAYPKRAGHNPKLLASQNFSARVKEGISPDALINSAHRYSAFIEAIGKSGTEYVMQASSFLGPKSRGFENPWDPPPETKRPQPKPMGERFDEIRNQLSRGKT
jgi:hypothetical protein